MRAAFRLDTSAALVTTHSIRPLDARMREYRSQHWPYSFQNLDLYGQSLPDNELACEPTRKSGSKVTAPPFNGYCCEGKTPTLHEYWGRTGSQPYAIAERIQVRG